MTDSAADNELRTFRNALRSRLIAAREALPAGLHTQLSRKIERHLGALVDALNPAVLAFCWPFRGEFDARALVSGRLPGGLRACLPVVMDSDSPLEFREWTPQSEMIEDRYGIHIPARGAALRPDVILMPLNGFDEAGYRLGYGGGYYDRTLAAMADAGQRPVSLGVAFAIQEIETVPHESWDRRLDLVLTERGVLPLRDAPKHNTNGSS